MNKQKTVTLKEARFAIGCGEKFLRAEIARGAIEVRRVNARVILVDANSLNEYIESRCATIRRTDSRKKVLISAANNQNAVRVYSMNSTTALVNKTKRTFELVEQAVGENLRSDLIARGWDGTAWIGTAKAEGKRKECVALFYRGINGQYDFAL